MRFPMTSCLWLTFLVESATTTLAQEQSDYVRKPPGYDVRSEYPDSFEYYGPQGLWRKLQNSSTLREGRDTWFFWTGGSGPGGTQFFYRALSVHSSLIPLRGKIQFYKVAELSHKDRWEQLGLINEPNCDETAEPDLKTGLKLNRVKPDPMNAYPTDPEYGQSSGVVGLRMFPNPRFEAAKWDYDAYTKDPGLVEPPHLFGITCAFCHVAFDPLNPPKDPVRPRWENLAANIGNQYLHEGRLFFGREGLFQFDECRALNSSDFVWQYGETQQRGTSETSRFSYDFLNNPNTINAIFNVGQRVQFFETTPPGRPQRTLHVLKDGADSVGLEMGLARVFINIGMEGPYWIDHLWNPITGTQQSPFLLDDIRRKAPPERLQELDARYASRPGDPRVGYTQDWPMGKSWALTEKRIPALISYLLQYTPMHLRDAQGGARYLLDPQKNAGDAERLKRGKRVFADHCAECHSNRQPHYLLTSQADRREFYRNSVLADDFLVGNTLASDERIPVTRIQTNVARSLATNAIEGDIWADFSSRNYKALPPLGPIHVPSPIGGLITFVPPGGGRGYYRPASLVSLWATAPYLHNNSVGPLTVDPSKTVPDPSVEERVELFERGMRQMLLIDPRPNAIKVTSEECTLIPPDVARRVLASLAAKTISRKLAPGLDRAVEKRLLSPAAAASLAHGANEALEKKFMSILEGGQLFANATFEAFAQQSDTVAAALADALTKKFDADPAVKSVLPKLLAEVKPELQQGATTVLSDLRSLVNLDIRLPKSFPINLLLNLRVDKVPYVVVLLSQARDDREALVRGLLALSDCPDLIEDHGHPFGTTLSVPEKQDLIEFLKTF
jgi:hypothetical protein